MSFVSFLYKLARTANDIEKIASGDPKRIAKRTGNKLLGRKVIKKLCLSSALTS